MVVVITGLASVEVRRRDPFGFAVLFSGPPAAGFDAAIVVAAGQSLVIDVGLSAVGPIGGTVVDLAVIGRFGTAREGAAAVPGVQHDSLGSRRQPSATAEVERFCGVIVEHRQVVVSRGGLADHLRHRQQNCRHR